MNKIKSFTVNHTTLIPGIYESRVDSYNDTRITTLDIRLKRPNIEPVLYTAEIHTMEHLGATYLRNHAIFKDRIVYFGPMGCRTGFYLLVEGDHHREALYNLIVETFQFIRDFEGEIPGNTAIECGNYLDHNLTLAKQASSEYIDLLRKNERKSLNYPD